VEDRTIFHSLTHCTYSIIFKEYAIEERIEEGANGSVDLSKYYQKSWTRAPFTNEEWVAEVGKGMEWMEIIQQALQVSKIFAFFLFLFEDDHLHLHFHIPSTHP